MSPAIAVALIFGAAVGAAALDTYLKFAKRARRGRSALRALRRLRLVLTTRPKPVNRRPRKGARR
ncbi:hypothetical protein GCM10027570_31100 [Streptomonospora sediminis]